MPGAGAPTESALPAEASDAAARADLEAVLAARAAMLEVDDGPVTAPSIDAHAQRAARREAAYLAGRLLLASVFIVSAVLKGLSYDAAAAGALGGVFWLTLVLELACGGLLALGLYARPAALVMLVWISVGLLFFHGDLAVETHRVLALANLGIAGGLFVFVANGAGLLSLDRWLRRRGA